MSHTPTRTVDVIIERVQTGVRMEKRLLKVLKALADSLDLSLGDLLEGIVLHAFEGKAPFSKPTRAKVAELRKVFGLTLTAANAHHLKEQPHARR
jgi:predicted DNA-binding ribbon-helix-helix protein